MTYGKVVDHCYLCDMCYMTKCPYVPPHPWNVDFPHLMLRAKAVKNRNGGAPLSRQGIELHGSRGQDRGHPGDQPKSSTRSTAAPSGRKSSMRPRRAPRGAGPPIPFEDLRGRLRGGAAIRRRAAAGRPAARWRCSRPATPTATSLNRARSRGDLRTQRHRGRARRTGKLLRDAQARARRSRGRCRFRRPGTSRRCSR